MLNQSGEEVGRLVDLVASMDGGDDYPAVTGMVVRVGRRQAYLDASVIDHVDRRSVTLRTARMDLREFQRREGEVLLARDILDHQLVDTDEVQVIRAADLYLAQVGDQVRLVGVDVSLQTLLRRLGPKRFRWHPTPDRVIDWAAIESFGEDSPEAPAADEAAQPRARRCAGCAPPNSPTCWKSWAGPGRKELLASLDHDLAADVAGGDGAGRADRAAAGDGTRAGRRPGRGDGARRGRGGAARPARGGTGAAARPDAARHPAGAGPAARLRPPTRPAG